MSTPPDDVYLLKDDVIYGPHPIGGLRELLAAGWLSPEHHYWQEGLSIWTPVAEIVPQTAPAAETTPAEVETTVAESSDKTAPRISLSRLIYRPPEVGFIAYGLGVTIALHVLLFLGLSWRFGYAQETREALPLSAPPDPPMEISLVTEQEPAPPPPPQPPEVAETPSPSEPLPLPPPVPDIPQPQPPPAPVEMPLPVQPILAPPALPLPQISEQPPPLTPIRSSPLVRKIVAATHPVPPVAAPPEEIAQANPTDYLDAPAPNYPYSAQLRHQEGTVELLVTLDAHGQPIDASIYQSSGWSILDQSARNQVLDRWRFKPGNSSRVLVPIEFSLAH